VADTVLRALRPLMPAGVERGEVRREGRVIRWVESGRGEPVVILDAAAAEPGSLAWAGVMPLVAAHTRVQERPAELAEAIISLLGQP
jgi:hypothetical protein